MNMSEIVRMKMKMHLKYGYKPSYPVYSVIGVVIGEFEQGLFVCVTY